jgi:hypothetical protein
VAKGLGFTRIQWNSVECLDSGWTPGIPVGLLGFQLDSLESNQNNWSLESPIRIGGGLYITGPWLQYPLPRSQQGPLQQHPLACNWQQPLC